MVDISFFKKLQLSKGLSELWQKKGDSIIGIDFGSSSLKIIQLRMEKEKAILETYGELSVKNYAKVDLGRAAILSEDKMLEMIGDLIKESGVKSENAVTSISLKNSFVTIMNLPNLSDSELKKAVPYEMRRYIPVPISEVEMDWWILPKGFQDNDSQVEEKAKKDITKVLLVAIHKNIIEQRRSLIEKAKLKSKAFEVEIFSTVRSLLKRELVPLMIIDFGASSTKMIIVDYGIVRMAHRMDRGAQDITNVLSRSLGVDFARAEKLKREVGLSKRPEHKEMKEVMSTILDYIFSEAASLSSDYRIKEGRSINRVILTGGGALLKGITDMAVNKFGVEVSLANPFAKLDYPAFLEPALREIGPNFSTAIGLVLRELK